MELPRRVRRMVERRRMRVVGRVERVGRVVLGWVFLRRR